MHTRAAAWPMKAVIAKDIRVERMMAMKRLLDWTGFVECWVEDDSMPEL